jgi:ribosomal protein S18 acetylase RimI-like enzyme
MDIQDRLQAQKLKFGERAAVDIVIRPATMGDAAAIADLHVRVWRETYRELAPTEVYHTVDVTYRHGKWVDALSTPRLHQLVLVAEGEGRIVGIGMAGAPSEALFGGRGELKSLHVDGALQRQGIGRRLIAGLASHLLALDYRGVALSIVAGNEPAIAFYRSLGGQLIGRCTDPGPIWHSDNLVFAWDDPARLIGSSKA